MCLRVTSSPRILFLNTTLLIAVLQFVLAPAATAVCPEPLPAPNAEFFRKARVFTGKVLSEKPESDPNDGSPNGWFYRMRVEKTFRGRARKIVTVYTENASARFPLKVGERYLLFAYWDEGRLSIDSCGNSSPLSEAEGAIEAIEAIRKAGPYGEIEGRVQQELGEAGLPGIRIVARSGKLRFSTLSREDGWFQLRVPAGRYELTASSLKFIVVQHNSDLSYDDPDHFIVHKGGSAHFEYIASPK